MTKSHEYISKTILKNFSFSDGGKKRAVKYIKLPKTRIRHGDIKTLNTRLGAYSDENEYILSSEFETYLGDLNAKIEEGLKTTRTLCAKDFDIAKIKKYFMYQCWRDDVFVDDLLCGMKKVSGEYPPEMFEKFLNGDISQAKNRLIAEAFNGNFAEKMFREYKFIIAIDDNANLIGSSYVVSLASDGGHSVLAIALSPKVIFLLVDKNLLRGPSLALGYMKDDDGGGAWEILGPNDVANINTRTVTLGMRLGFGYVVSNSDEQLKKAIKGRGISFQ